MTKPLSPAARAVLNAADSAFDQAGTTRQGIAAALRAAADQVVPEPSDIDKGSFSLAAIRNRCKVRDQLLAIAAELEGGDD
jgi:hypothetical protein